MINVYPVWWDKTLTIFNKYEDRTTNQIFWFKHVVNNAFWKEAGNKITINNVELGTNEIICRIRKDSTFLENYQWAELTTEEKSSHFTLNEGDIIVKGEVTDNINEYESGHRSTDLLGKYKALQGCLKISQFVINVGKGRCNEHYYVEGE